jgi:hypothetical protein
VARLEYRLYGVGNEFPLLYHYDSMDQEEVALRFECDYFVKDGIVYEKTSCAVEAACFVVYVIRSFEERVMPWGSLSTGQRSGYRLELREYRDLTADYRLIRTYTFHGSLEMLLHLQANYLYNEGKEWYRTSTEIDEDRETFVVYAVIE